MMYNNEFAEEELTPFRMWGGSLKCGGVIMSILGKGKEESTLIKPRIIFDGYSIRLAEDGDKEEEVKNTFRSVAILSA